MSDAPAKLNAHLWARHPDDWYVEERFAVAELFKHERFPGGVWDPCCGMGHIVLEAWAAGYVALGTDIADRGAPGFGGWLDFLKAPVAYAASIVMNPPFRNGRPADGIEAFVRKAMSLQDVEKIAAFVPARFLWGKTRARDFWTKHPPARVYMVTPRPSCPPGTVIAAGVDPGGGKEDFAWAVWERALGVGSWPNLGTQLKWITADKPKRARK